MFLKEEGSIITVTHSSALLAKNQLQNVLFYEIGGDVILEVILKSDLKKYMTL